MKILLAIFMTSLTSINGGDLASKLLKPTIQAATVNLRHDVTNNAVVAHHHLSHAGAFYDTILTKSLQDGSLVVKSYKSSIKAGAIVPPLSPDEHKAIIDLLKTRIEMTNA